MHSSRSYCHADQLIFRARVQSLSRSRVARSTASRARVPDTRACARRVTALFGILRQLFADWPRFLSTRNGRTNDGTLQRRDIRVVDAVVARCWRPVVPSCRINRKSESAARATRDESASRRKDVTVTYRSHLSFARVFHQRDTAERPSARLLRTKYVSLLFFDMNGQVHSSRERLGE